MCVKVVADKDDLFCIGVILIHQPLYLMGPVTLFSGFIDGAPPPSAQRFVEHEGAAGAFFLYSWSSFLIWLVSDISIGWYASPCSSMGCSSIQTRGTSGSYGLEYSSSTSSMAATNAAFWSGGMHHIFFR